MSMPLSGNAFTKRFLIEPKQQSVWRMSHATWFTAMGVGGALYIDRVLFGLELGRFLGITIAELLSLVLIGIGGLILIADLGQPLRFWRALRNVRTSWIAVGAVCDFIFMGLGILAALADLQVGGGRPLGGLPWAEGTLLALVFQIVSGLAAFVIIVYPGFALSYSPSIPFWNTTLIPLQFLLYAFASALGLAWVAAVVSGEHVLMPQELALGAVLLLILALVAFAAHLIGAIQARGTARFSALLLVKGPLAGRFLGGTLVLGLVCPLAVAVWLAAGDAVVAPIVALVAGLLTLPGNWLSKYGVLEAGYYPPLL